MDDTEDLYEEVLLYINYSVAQEQLPRARELLKRYRQSEVVLRILREYYVALPDAQEEAVHKIAKLADRRGVYLFVLVAGSNSYLYAESSGKVAFVGEYRRELDAEALACFGIEDAAGYHNMCVAENQLAAFDHEAERARVVCPVCGVAEGEFHLLGCAVEVCPWCEGQLSNCNCRFDQLQKEVIESDQDLDELAELLDKKGRIPFAGEQAPAYPGTSKGLDRGGR